MFSTNRFCANNMTGSLFTVMGTVQYMPVQNQVGVHTEVLQTRNALQSVQCNGIVRKKGVMLLVYSSSNALDQDRALLLSRCPHRKGNRPCKIDHVSNVQLGVLVVLYNSCCSVPNELLTSCGSCRVQFKPIIIELLPGDRALSVLYPARPMLRTIQCY